MTRRHVLTLGAAAALCALLPGTASAEDRQRRYVIGVAGMT
jgi:hypothetical protein